MTHDDRLPTDWDDDRLAAAFAARTSARATPHDLADATIDAVRRRRASRRPSRIAVLAGLAAAAAIAAVAVIIALPRAGDRAGDRPSAFGLPLVTVSEALRIRDLAADARELAVAGFYTSIGPMPCPAPLVPDQNPTHLWCSDLFTWLMEQPETLVTTTANAVDGHPPVGPAFHPTLGLVTMAGFPNDPTQVVSVVLIGHFDDRRARLCVDADRSACADAFVVDRVQQVGDRILPTATVADGTPILDASTVDAAVTSVDPRLAILSRRVIDGDRLVDSEPLLATARFSHFTQFDAPLVWVVTAIVPSADGAPVQPRTFIVPDGPNLALIGEITADNVERIDLVASADPSATAVPPTATPTASENPATTWLGAPITVSEAIDHRDNHLDDTELAVKGFAWAPTGPIACTAIRPASPALDQCPDGFTQLAERDPGPPTGPEFLQPDGPSIPLLVRRETYRQVQVGDVPRAVIVLGHFDDHRSAACPTGQVDQCRHNFLVDAILDPEAPGIDRNAIESTRPDPDVRPVASVEDVERAMPVRGPRGADFVVAAFAVSGRAIVSYEPRAADAPELTSAAAVWVVRYLDFIEVDRPVVRTALIVDGPSALIGRIYLPTRDGLETIIRIID